MRAIERPSITAVFDHYNIRILREGAGWTKCECPSLEHEDMNPSASVNEDLGKWNCFSCGRTGDGLDIIMERESLSLREASAWAARQDIKGASSGVQPKARNAARTSRGSWTPPWTKL